MKYHVLYTETRETIREEPGEWGFHEDRKTITPKMVSVLRPDSRLFDRYSWEDVESDDVIQPGDHVFVISVVYSDGGTFGCTHGYREWIYVTNNQEKAIEVKENYEKFHMERNGYLPWSGYFASLESVEVDFLPAV